MSAGEAAIWQRLIPQTLLCSAIYRIARCSAPWCARPLNAWFAGHYGLDLSEAEKPDVRDYACLNDLFTRALAPGARPVAAGTNAVVSPADGTLTEFGSLEADTLLQAKGMRYSLTGLAAESEPDVEPFRDGQFATIYLAPHDYHRVHMPIAGTLMRTRYVPGSRFSVNEATAASVRRLFVRNERTVLSFSANRPWLLVMVGALNVSSISISTRGEIPSGTARCWEEDGSATFGTGAEIGRFNLGSTVIVVFPRETLQWRHDLARGMQLKMGERIATLRRTEA